MNEVNIDAIARTIANLIQEQVDIHTEISDDEGAYESIICELKNEYENAKALYEDMKKHGFSANTIETEGYLRAMTRVMSIVDYYKPEK